MLNNSLSFCLSAACAHRWLWPAQQCGSAGLQMGCGGLGTVTDSPRALEMNEEGNVVGGGQRKENDAEYRVIPKSIWGRIC